MIPFNRPAHTGNEEQYVLSAMRGNKLSGDGPHARLCQEWFERVLNCNKALLTPSCTQALEMAALLVDIQPGDEVIMPSYTFVSTANAFVLRGARIVFVDIRPDTMNIDERLIESAITSRTKVIVPVHYAGVGCEMDIIMEIARRHNLFVIEDAAQAMMATYRGRHLGTLGHMATFSFHETKNFTSGGEGGLLIINDSQFANRAEILREKGTNRCRFFRGEVDKYTWVDIGSSYLPSEIQAAYLWGQLEKVEDILTNRMDSWSHYNSAFIILQDRGKVDLPYIPSYCNHNAHIYYLKTRNLAERTALLSHLNAKGIHAVFHYVPLHNTAAGLEYSRFNGLDKYTTSESEKLIRLPIFYGLAHEEIDHIIDNVFNFYSQ